MDDARERVDLLGEEATQNESLGAALDRAYAARFASGASSLPAGTEQAQHSSTLQDKTQPATRVDNSSALAENAAEPDGAQPGPGDMQPKLAMSDQAPDAQVASSAIEVEEAAPELNSRQAEPPAQPEDDDAEAQAFADSALIGDEQQGGAAAAASVHVVPEEAAAAAASACEAAATAADTASAAATSASAQDASASAESPTKAGDGHAEPEQELPKSLDELQQRILDWHWSNLEYGCSAPLHKVQSPAFVCGVCKACCCNSIHRGRSDLLHYQGSMHQSSHPPPYLASAQCADEML